MGLQSDVISYNQYKKDCFLNGEVPVINLEYERILKARYNKISRIKKRVRHLFIYYDYVYFLTFTFDDKHLHYSDRAKRDKIKNVLSPLGEYILNVDFGKLNEREHYHVILGSPVVFNMVKYRLQDYNYGFFHIEQVRSDCKSLSKLSKYINKLSNHTTKDSAYSNRVYFHCFLYNIRKKLYSESCINLADKIKIDKYFS